jgi:hypothetical protein
MSSMMNKSVAAAFLSFFMLLWLAGCSGPVSDPALPLLAENGNGLEPGTASGPANGLAFPDPARLSTGIYTQELPGSEYNIALPSNRFSTEFPQGIFSPLVEGTELEDYAYAGYLFDMGTDPIEAVELSFDWQTLPGEESPLWLAFANWEMERWDVFEFPNKAHFTLAEFEPYRGDNNFLAFVVIAGGIDELRLDKVAVAYEGNFFPNARLVLDPPSGEAPFEVVLDASTSDDEEGEIVLYEFDTDNDGVYEHAGSEPTHSFICEVDLPEPRIRIPMRVRVTDNGGKSATAFKDLIVLNPEYEPGVIDPSCIPGMDKELIIVDGRPAVAYFDLSIRALCYGITAETDGVSEWETKTLDYDLAPSLPLASPWLSMALIDGRPAIAWSKRNSAEDPGFDLA